VAPDDRRCARGIQRQADLLRDVDLQIQKKLYQGLFESWYGNPNLGGFMIWEWPPDQGGPENRGYIPKGKPAEKVLREWMAKPRGKVQ